MLDGEPCVTGERARIARGRSGIGAKPPLHRDLQEIIARIEAGGTAGNLSGRVLSTGLGELDSVLPGKGLALAALHEIQGGAAAWFALHLLSRCFRPKSEMDGFVLWCVQEGRRDHLYGPGLWQAGVDPHRVAVAVCRDREEFLWTVEEGLKSGSVMAVVAQMGKAGVVGKAGGVGKNGSTEKPLDLTASRRLQLAAEAGGGLGFVVSATPVLGSSAAVSRWVVEPDQAVLEDDGDCWRVSLARLRGGFIPTTGWQVYRDRFGSISARCLSGKGEVG